MLYQDATRLYCELCRMQPVLFGSLSPPVPQVGCAQRQKEETRMTCIPIKFCLPEIAFSISAYAYFEALLSYSFAYLFISALQSFRFFFNF